MACKRSRKLYLPSGWITLCIRFLAVHSRLVRNNRRAKNQQTDHQRHEGNAGGDFAYEVDAVHTISFLFGMYVTISSKLIGVNPICSTETLI